MLLFADLMPPETSGSPCVSVPILKAVSDETRIRKLGPCSGTLKGIFTTVSNCFRKEGRIQGPGVPKEMGSRVGPEGGVGNSLIHSAICSSDLVCTMSIRAGGVGVRMSWNAPSSSSISLTTSPKMGSTTTSLTCAGVSAGCVLGECGVSGLVGVSSSWFSAEDPG